jgi:hypothetical protein
MRAQLGAARSLAPHRHSDGMDAGRGAYEGPDRRRHRVYVTRNTEYHFRDGLCVAVRDRRTGQFMQGHLALRGRIDAGIKFFDNGSMAPSTGEPRPGESLYFASEGRDLVTSPLESVERPTRGTVASYPQRQDR